MADKEVDAKNAVEPTFANMVDKEVIAKNAV